MCEGGFYQKQKHSENTIQQPKYKQQSQQERGQGWKRKLKENIVEIEHRQPQKKRRHWKERIRPKYFSTQATLEGICIGNAPVFSFNPGNLDKQQTERILEAFGGE